MGSQRGKSPSPKPRRNGRKRKRKRRRKRKRPRNLKRNARRIWPLRYLWLSVFPSGSGDLDRVKSVTMIAGEGALTDTAGQEDKGDTVVRMRIIIEAGEELNLTARIQFFPLQNSSIDLVFFAGPPVVPPPTQAAATPTTAPAVPPRAPSAASKSDRWPRRPSRPRRRCTTA